MLLRGFQPLMLQLRRLRWWLKRQALVYRWLGFTLVGMSLLSAVSVQLLFSIHVAMYNCSENDAMGILSIEWIYGPSGF